MGRARGCWRCLDAAGAAFELVVATRCAVASVKPVLADHTVGFMVQSRNVAGRAEVSMKVAVNWMAVAVQFAAAVLWIASTRVSVSAKQLKASYERETGKSGGPAMIVDNKGREVNATAARQSRWSGYAALATAAGVALQGIANALS